MKHALIDQSSPQEIAAAKEAADWLIDAIACATQNRTFLRGDKEYDDLIGEAIVSNAVIACLRFNRNRSGAI